MKTQKIVNLFVAFFLIIILVNGCSSIQRHYYYENAECKGARTAASQGLDLSNLKVPDGETPKQASYEIASMILKRVGQEVPYSVMTKEALDKPSCMPPELIEIAKKLSPGESGIECVKGEGENPCFSIRNYDGIIIFSVIEEFDISYRGETITYRVNGAEQWIRIMISREVQGVVFAKSAKSGKIKLGMFGEDCQQFFAKVDGESLGFAGANKSLISACERFEGKRQWAAAREHEPSMFLKSLIEKYGKDGVLTLDKLEKLFLADTRKVNSLMISSKESSGYIRFDKETGNYYLVKGPLLRAELYHDECCRPNVFFELAFYGYIPNFSSVKIEFRYKKDGESIWISRPDNSSYYLFYYFDKDDVSRSNSLEGSWDKLTFIRFPYDLRPTATIQVVATVKGEDGATIIKDEVIGVIEY